MADETTTLVPAIPPLMHLPLAKSFSIASYLNGQGRLAIRRKIWDGVSIIPDTDPDEIYPVKWIYYEGGIWFIIEDNGEDVGIASVRVVAAGDVTEEDFAAWDWTTYSPGCLSDGVCDSGLEYVDLFSIVPPYDLVEEITIEAPLSLASPNASDCGNPCATPPVPGYLIPEYEIPYDPGSIAAGVFQIVNRDGSIPGEGEEADGESGSIFVPGGGGGGGGAAGGGGGKPPRKPRRKADTFSISITNIANDLPGCIPRLDDGCGRLCLDPPNPHCFTMDGFDVTINDPDDPGAIWFVTGHFRGDQVLNTTASDGDTVGAAILAEHCAPWGAMIAITVSAWKAGGSFMSATAQVTIPQPCEYVGDDCGDPCAS